MRFALFLVIPSLFLAAPGSAEDVPPEIDYLLATIGSSDCVFIRNGKHHDAADAEDHLRMKYRRGKRYAPTTEAFIERLASKSSMSKKLYHIHCPGEELVPSGEWLTERLVEYREAQQERIE
ncbi:MAG: DUF5329 domain-containing protein [Gammaproteobacteria bacterium]|nr:DUF5329 domain-containing protein [Gammaproteobacteria bacterium]